MTMNNNYPVVYPGMEDSNTDAQLLTFQAKLWELLAKQTCRYTSGESSSVPNETAQELLTSLCFILQMDSPDGPDTLRLLADSDLEERFAAGIKIIEKKIQLGKKLWEGACLSLPAIENISLQDTLKSIGKAWRLYDYRFFAHQVPCDIDYQLCHPVRETLLGIDYVNQYLRHILTESDFLRRFDPDLCIRLLQNYCLDYKGQLINLYEPAAANALGLTLVQGDVLQLDINKQEREKLARIFAPLTKPRALEILRSAAERLSMALNIKSAEAKQYLSEFAVSLYPRINAVLPYGNLSGIFLPLHM